MKITKMTGSILLGTFLLFGCSNDQEQASSDQPQFERPTQTVEDTFSQLEEEYDARLGIYALDTGTGETVTYRSDERFIYASAHKPLAVGVLLQQKSMEELDELITYSSEDLVNYNPITENHVDSGLTLKELSDASIRYSDNTAANLIFHAIGGPEGFKEGLRAIGDNVTEPERIEPDLNDVEPGEIQDTSTPEALAKSLQQFTLGDALSDDKQELLIDWLKRNTTGDALIRAGVPEGWEVGDKTGSGSYGTRNDIGILWPPGRDPIILSVLTSKEERDAEHDDALIARATEEVINILFGTE
ncbi:class A beta-lactamase [Halalkalibacterium halodurans]|uniref:class A beta-lactamase n=1 Tax=Halalkalibacterium halodurans TaxID=86665 RepID=UPI002AAA61FF|nr:class A beta-lactamase [Halalkalibacterium halodurans]MDY7220800.1 class A beta-lactamase [Halalkalibacterium halodurans]MDY7240039.1 class A beta-lactamase [Halalkalibacterium halodurans]